MIVDSERQINNTAELFTSTLTCDDIGYNQRLIDSAGL
jgi:hypothetical protein